MSIKVLHWSLFAPNRSGMYHTTKDLVIAQQAAGIDAQMVCAFRPETVHADGDFRTVTSKWKDVADIYVLSSRINPPAYNDGTPIVFLLHGHPLYSWQSELYGLEPANPTPWTTSLRYFGEQCIQRFVTFWPDQLPYWQALDGPRKESRVRLVPRGIMFGDRFTPQGPKEELAGDPVLVIADQFRLFKDSFALWFAAREFQKRHPEARLHMYVIPPADTKPGEAIRRVISESELRYVVGSLNPIHEHIERVFRAADIVLTSVISESRVALEAMACGADVVSQFCDGTHEACFRSPATIADTIEKVWLERQEEGPGRRERLSREVRERFDIRRTVEGMRQVYEELL